MWGWERKKRQRDDINASSKINPGPSGLGPLITLDARGD